MATLLIPAILALAVLQACAPFPLRPGDGRAFTVRVVDSENGWPVPMVVLHTNHNTAHATDNNGEAAIHLPEFTDREVWFAVEGYGYEVPADGLGFRGVRLMLRPGGRAEVRVRRTQPAMRLGRLTGAGLFRGEGNGVVAGCDSIQAAPWNGGSFLAWGDTAFAGRPLGIFHAIGAMAKSPYPVRPPVRPEFALLTDTGGMPRAIAPMPGEGPTWLTGLAALPDGSGRPHLVSSYQKARGLVEVHQTGLCEWDEKAGIFQHVRTLWKKSHSGGTPPAYPEGHAVFSKDAAGGWRVLFGNPFPRLSMPASRKAWGNPEEWTRLDSQKKVLRRSGGSVKPHSGSIAWSAFLKKWVSVFTRDKGGKSPLGEVWMATAPDPTGPWGDAVKIADHGEMTFYNPCIHAGCHGIDGRTLLFEGTISTFFAANARPIPRHDYNQILYRVDL